MLSETLAVLLLATNLIDLPLPNGVTVERPAAHTHDDHDHDHGDDDHGDDHGHEHGSDEVQLTPEAVRVNGIRTEPAVRRSLASSFTAPARVAFNADAMAHVGSVLTGRIVELNVRLGDRVAKGDPLFVIESAELGESQSDFLLKLAEARAADVTVEPARLTYERGKALFDEGRGISSADLQKRETDWLVADAQATFARSSVEASRNRLKILGMDDASIATLEETRTINPRSTVRAVIGGEVIERDITLGELVSPDRDALLILGDVTRLWVVADVPESRVAQVSSQTTATIEIPAIPGSTWQGKVQTVSASLHAHTRTAAARIELENPGHLRPGMFARVQLFTADDTATSVIAVPVSAVLTVEGEPSVFVPVEGKPNRFARQAVKTGPAVGGMVPILSGLEAGHLVVTSGAFILKADLGKSGAAHEH